jgi:hypothetical protein
LTKVIGIAGTTITFDKAATVDGSAAVVVFQPENPSGRWYMYTEPADCLRVLSVYSLFPDFRGMSSVLGSQRNPYPWRHEKGYIFCDLDPNSNPYIEYIQWITDPFQWDSLFADALAMRLASKLAMSVTKDLNKKKDAESDYLGLITRAKIENLLDEEQEEENSFWTDR